MVMWPEKSLAKKYVHYLDFKKKKKKQFYLPEKDERT